MSLYICSESLVPQTQSTARADEDMDPFGVTPLDARATDDNLYASDVPAPDLEDLIPSSRYGTV